MCYQEGLKGTKTGSISVYICQKLILPLVSFNYYHRCVISLSLWMGVNVLFTRVNLCSGCVIYGGVGWVININHLSC